MRPIGHMAASQWRTAGRTEPKSRLRSLRNPGGQTVTEFVLLAGLLVGMAIAFNGIVPPGLRQFVGRVVTSISGVAP